MKSADKLLVEILVLSIACWTQQCAGQVTSQEATAVWQGEIPFTLPTLQYSTNALSSFLDAKNLQFHHDIYHGLTVTNLNKAVGKDINFYGFWRYGDHPSMEIGLKTKKWLEGMLKDPTIVPNGIRVSVLTNAGAHYNHSLFWQMMKPGGGGEPKGELADAIKTTFGSFDKFKQRFTDAAVKVDGNGWAWLTLDGGKLKIETTQNEDTPFSSGRQVLLGVDVWDHAYNSQYGKDRKAYVDAWFHVVNWDFVADRYGKLK